MIYFQAVYLILALTTVVIKKIQLYYLINAHASPRLLLLMTEDMCPFFAHQWTLDPLCPPCCPAYSTSLTNLCRMKKWWLNESMMKQISMTPYSSRCCLCPTHIPSELTINAKSYLLCKSLQWTFFADQDSMSDQWVSELTSTETALYPHGMGIRG